jgi:putative flippase GtrA
VKSVFEEALWYGFASLCALGADTGVLWMLVRLLSVNLVIAVCISFICGVSVAYLLSIRLAFQIRRVPDRRVEFPIFVALGLPGFAINTGALVMAVKFFGFNLLLGKGLAALMTFSYNFLARRHVLFKRRGSAA